MSNVLWFITYQLKKDVSIEDFLRASEQCNKEVLSRQKGFISWEVLRDGDTWVDLVKCEVGDGGGCQKGRNRRRRRPRRPRVLRFYQHAHLQAGAVQN